VKDYMDQQQNFVVAPHFSKAYWNSDRSELWWDITHAGPSPAVYL